MKTGIYKNFQIHVLLRKGYSIRLSSYLSVYFSDLSAYMHQPTRTQPKNITFCSDIIKGYLEGRDITQICRNSNKPLKTEGLIYEEQCRTFGAWPTEFSISTHKTRQGEISEPHGRILSQHVELNIAWTS